MKTQLYRLLRWSEKYTKTDMIYLARGGFWSIGGQVAAALIALGLAVGMARLVPKNVYGTYKYILAVLSLLGSFSLSGMSTAVFQSIARGYRRALVDGFWANIRWSFVVFLGALILGGYYLLRGNAVLGLGILLGGSLSPFLASFNLYLSLLSGEKDFRRIAWYGDVVTNFVPAGALVLVAYLAPSVPSLIATYFVANVVATAYAYWRSVERYPTPSSAPHDEAMLSYGKHLSVMNVVSTFAANIDQVLLFHFTGAVDLAIYNFAIGIPDQAKGPLKMLDTMTQARFVDRNTTDIHANIRNKMLWLVLFGVCVVVIYLLLAPFVFHLFFPSYMGAVPYSQIYAISLLAMIVNPAGSYLSAKKKVRQLYWNSLITSVLQVLLMTGGVIWYGLWGLIVARVVLRIGGSFATFGLYQAAVREDKP